jgi:hypothetical protein
LNLAIGYIKFKSLILGKSTLSTLKNTHVIILNSKSTIHYALMQLWHTDTKLKIYISFLQKNIQCLHIRRHTITSFSLLALKIYHLQLEFCHLSLKNSAVDLQQSVFERAIGSGKQRSVQSAVEQATTSGSIGLH